MVWFYTVLNIGVGVANVLSVPRSSSLWSGMLCMFIKLDQDKAEGMGQCTSYVRLALPDATINPPPTPYELLCAAPASLHLTQNH